MSLGRQLEHTWEGTHVSGYHSDRNVPHSGWLITNASVREVATYQVPGLALQDGGEDIVEADGALEQTGQVTVGGGGARQGGHALGGGALGGSCGQRGGSLATHF